MGSLGVDGRAGWDGARAQVVLVAARQLVLCAGTDPG
jgi:hypothetical protein